MKRRGFGTRPAIAAVATTVVLLASGVVFASPVLAYGTPTPPPLPSVSAGGYMSCTVQAGGFAGCWGDNSSEGPGQATPPPGVLFKELNGGYAHACGIRFDDTVACWGNNADGQSTPPSGTFTHVVAGFGQSCGIRTDRTLACWGNDDSGESTPPGGEFTQLTVGLRHGCALRDDKTMACWGSNTYGQATPQLGLYKQITSGNFDNCAIRDAESTVVCWGRNAFGQATVPGGAFEQVSAGFGHVCGIPIGDPGELECWGRNSELQGEPPPGKPFKNVSAGTYTSCGVRTDDTVVCWGDNAAGRVTPLITSRFREGDESPPGARPIPGRVGQLYNYVMTTTYMSAPAPKFVVTSGSLPPGLTLNPTGVISGTPTTEGTFAFRVSATNEVAPAAIDDLTITISRMGRGGGSPGHGGHGGHGGHPPVGSRAPG